MSRGEPPEAQSLTSQDLFAVEVEGMIGRCREFRLIASAFLSAMFGFHAPGAAADLGGDQEIGVAAQVSQSGNGIFAFSTHGRLLGPTGDVLDHDNLDCCLGYRALPVD